jgi:uncharacterized protein (TIGR02270 family)
VPVRPTTAPFAHLIEESFEEAAFLWKRWEGELASLTRNLDEVWSWTEDRLCGAMDGVRIAPRETLERLVRDSLTEGDTSKLSVCAHALAGMRSADAAALLEEVLRTATGARLVALIRGAEVAEIDGTFAPITRMLGRNGPQHAAALARLKAFRRATLGNELKLCYESGEVALQIAALRASRQLPSSYAAAWTQAGLEHPDAKVRMEAMESGIHSRIPNAWSAALSAARDLGRESAPLLRYIAMLGNAEDHKIVYAALAKPRLQRAAIWALGHLGTRDAAEHCLMAMKHPALARAAGEAYAAITGTDLARARLTAAEPETAPPSFQSDDLDADLVSTAEELWPLPDVQRVSDHWKKRAAGWEAGARHVRGGPISLEGLMQAVEGAPMLRRPDYLVELRVRTRGRYDVEPRALRAAQRAMMTVGRSRLAEAAA